MMPLFPIGKMDLTAYLLDISGEVDLHVSVVDARFEEWTAVFAQILPAATVGAVFNSAGTETQIDPRP